MADTTAGGPPPRPYPKIPSRARLGEVGAREWIALEKVHGAHFAVVCDPAGIRPAKRRESLGETALDGFFGVSRIWPALSVAAARFAATLPDAVVVTLYGELAGGHYPHPDVPAVPGAEPVQTGVWYAPDPRWLLFDATADGHWLADRCPGSRTCRRPSRPGSRPSSACPSCRTTSPRATSCGRPAVGRSRANARWPR
ncbi:RNA ligase family protein [Streptomyces mayteni]